VEEALKMLIRVNRQTGIRELRGKVQWAGNPDVVRGAGEKIQEW
jgi:hypothetical protein